MIDPSPALSLDQIGFAPDELWPHSKYFEVDVGDGRKLIFDFALDSLQLVADMADKSPGRCDPKVLEGFWTGTQLCTPKLQVDSFGHV